MWYLAENKDVADRNIDVPPMRELSHAEHIASIIAITLASSSCCTATALIFSIKRSLSRKLFLNSSISSSFLWSASNFSSMFACIMMIKIRTMFKNAMQGWIMVEMPWGGGYFRGGVAVWSTASLGF
jgi:hypothetical protein